MTSGLNTNKRLSVLLDQFTSSAKIRAELRRAGFGVKHARVSIEQSAALLSDHYNIIILGYSECLQDTLQFIEKVRLRLGRFPIILLVASVDDVKSMVDALHAGADLCLAAAMPELVVAHITSLLRRDMAIPIVRKRYGHLTIEEELSRVYMHGLPIKLTAKEYLLVLLLLQNVGRTVSRERLLNEIWNGEFSEKTRTLDVHVSRVRAKLGLVVENGFQLTALYGNGYRLDIR